MRVEERAWAGGAGHVVGNSPRDVRRTDIVHQVVAILIGPFHAGAAG